MIATQNSVSAKDSKTQDEINGFKAHLEAARITLSSPRAHRALGEYLDGGDLKTCIAEAVRHEATARNQWIESALDPWCQRHGITREQAISIVFNDDSFNPENPQKDLVTRESILGWSGQQNAFAMWLMAEAKMAATPVHEEAEEQVIRQSERAG